MAAFFPRKKRQGKNTQGKARERLRARTRRLSLFVERLESRQVFAIGEPINFILEGTAFYDENANAQRDADELGLSGQLIYIDSNDNQQVDADEMHTFTDDNGNYSLAIPNHSTAIIRQVILPGWVQTFPSAGGHHVGPAADTIITGLDFGNRIADPIYYASIQGNVWNDVSQDGQKNANERGLEGWQLFLDQNDNGLIDPGEQWTFSDNNGNYRFDNVIPNNYSVREVLRTGWQYTSPADGKHVVAAGPRDTIVNVNFGNTLIQSGEIRGSKWNDANGNGVRDTDETGIAGWQIFLDDNLNGKLDANERSTTTDLDGNYSFKDVPLGKQVIGEAMPEVWRQQFPGKPGGFIPAPLEVIPFAPANVGAQGNLVLPVDLNGNGKQDLFVFDRGRGLISLLNNMGVGRFASPNDLFVGRDVKFALTGDVDGDHDQDIVTIADQAATGLQPRQIRIDTRRNNGDGTFTFASTTSVDGVLDYGTLADVNKDGKLDVLLSRYLNLADAGTQMAVLTNDGTGVFTLSPNRLVSEAETGAIVSVDFNGDGYVDRMVADAALNQLAFFRNNGQGLFLPPAFLAAGLQPIFMVMGDLNGDQQRDVVAVNQGSNDFSVFLNNGDGTFAGEVRGGSGLSGPLSAILGDLNGDQTLDLSITSGTSGRASVFFNDGSGTFGEVAHYNVGVGPSSIVTGDLNLDGALDLTVANSGSNNVTVLINDGSGVFSLGGNYDVGAAPSGIMTGYLNSDSAVDLLVITVGGAKLELLNNGDGSFGAVLPLQIDRANRSIAAADMSGDGFVDFLSPRDFTNFVSLWVNDSHGYYFESQSIDVGDRASFITTGDLNGDGKIDFLTSYLDSKDLGIYLNSGDGTFVWGGAVSLPQAADSVTTGDLDGDGDIDIAVATNTGTIITNMNNGSGVFTASPGVSAAGASSIMTGDLNGDGRTDLVTVLAGHSVGLLMNDFAPAYRHKTDVSVGSVSEDQDFGNQKLSWRNSAKPQDIDGDHFIAPLDALILINFLNKNGSVLLTSQTPFERPFLDPTGDDFIAPNDVLLVINYLNLHPGGGEGEEVVSGGAVSSADTTSSVAIRMEAAVRSATAEGEFTERVSAEAQSTPSSSFENSAAVSLLVPWQGNSSGVTNPALHTAPVSQASKGARELLWMTAGPTSAVTVASGHKVEKCDDDLESMLDDLAADVADAWQHPSS